MQESDERKEEFEDTEMKVKGELRYETCLIFQINRISQLLSRDTPENQESLEWAVDALYQMLLPYIDDIYEKEQKELLDKDLDPFLFSTCRYGLLMKLMDRLNLLLEKTKKGRFK